MPQRKNSIGYDTENEITKLNIEKLFSSLDVNFTAYPIVNGNDMFDLKHKVFNPSDLRQCIGQVAFSSKSTVLQSINTASKYFPIWKNFNLEKKIAIITKFAELLESNQEKLLKICVLEAGKTIKDSINDIREAIDFCYYYASEALRIFKEPIELQGPTGEKNKLVYEGKGVIFTISPWNFPIAIFTGQIVAPLLAGNTIIAKPAEQTSIIAYELVKLFLQAGLPKEALQLLLGEGENIGYFILNDPRIRGVLFTGSCETANKIKKNLNKKEGEIIPLTAETGGINFMIIDSSALTEQVVDDAIESGFYSAGQRCSALRILAIQEEVYEKTIKMLIGATKKIKVGLPYLLSTDIGPVIDQEAKDRINNHIQSFSGKVLVRTPISKENN